jgi:hypothetical protein
MNYPEEKVLRAFQIYTYLARDGVAPSEATREHMADEDVRSLLEKFAQEVSCVIIRTSEALYMIPESKLSPFHVSNDWIKRNYLKSTATNADIYLLYFTAIILFGSFFDRYNSQEQTIEFLRLDHWAKRVNERIDYLRSLGEEKLVEMEGDFSYNWRLIIDKWEDMDDIKETAKKQTGNTISRLSFIDTAKRFLISQGLIREIGNNEVTITEKAKIIVQRYFMDTDYNKNIFEFLYGWEDEKDASDQ